jgi:EmrB/QacA subfamily drug resistance transporter
MNRTKKTKNEGGTRGGGDLPHPERPPIPKDVLRVTGVVVVGSFMSLLDSTIVNIALRTLSISFRAGLDQTQWAVTAYLIAVATVIPLVSWASKRFGARRLFLYSIALFTIGSAVCGLARTPGELIAARVLQGLAGGLALPAGTIILTRKSGPTNLARVMAILGTVTVLAPILGPAVGGLLLGGLGWRSIFFVNVPFGLLAVIWGIRVIPREGCEAAGRLDFLGLCTASAGLVSLVYGLSRFGATEASRPRSSVPSGILFLSGGILLIVLFVLRCLHTDHPLLNLRLYRRPVFSASAFSVFSFGATVFGGVILLPLYYQIVRHNGIILTGLLVAPGGIGGAAGNLLAGRLTDRIGAGRTILIGAFIVVIATIPFVLIGPNTSYVFLSVALFVRGVGVGLSMIPAMTAAYRVIDRSEVADASPQLNILNRIGSSLGTALVTMLLQSRASGTAGSGALQAAVFGSTFVWVLALAIGAMAPALVLTTAERRGAQKNRTVDVARRESRPSHGEREDLDYE